MNSGYLWAVSPTKNAAEAKFYCLFNWSFNSHTYAVLSNTDFSLDCFQRTFFRGGFTLDSFTDYVLPHTVDFWSLTITSYYASNSVYKWCEHKRTADNIVALPSENMTRWYTLDQAEAGGPPILTALRAGTLRVSSRVRRLSLVLSGAKASRKQNYWSNETFDHSYVINYSLIHNFSFLYKGSLLFKRFLNSLLSLINNSNFFILEVKVFWILAETAIAIVIHIHIQLTWISMHLCML